jgi:hypothetical protein
MDIRTQHSREAISQWSLPDEHSNDDRNQTDGDCPTDNGHFGPNRWSKSSSWTSGRYWVVDGLSQDKVEDRTSDEGRGEVSREVVMQELLSSHEVEWEVVECPCSKEEQCTAVQPVSNTWESAGVLLRQLRTCKHTLFDGIEASSPREHIRSNDAHEDTERHGTDPETKQISDHVDLLLVIVVGPETDSAQAERPFNGFTSIRVISSQASIVLKHENLQFDKLLDEAAFLNFFGFDVDRTVSEIGTRPIGNDVVHKPTGGTILRVLVPVDFLLPESPFWQRCWMCPEQDFGWDVHKLEMSRQGFECLPVVSIRDIQVKEGIIPAILIVLRDSSEFLIGRHQGRGDIMSEQ